MDSKTYWLEFISGVIDRLYQGKDIDMDKSFAYNEGIKYTMIEETTEKYQKTIDELTEGKTKIK